MGSHLTAELLREGCSVRLIVRNAGKTDLLKATLRRMGMADRYDRIEFRQTALTTPPTLREAVRGTQVLFHCAAQVSFDPERADDIVSSNTEITTHIVNSCLECGVGLLVHCSSIATLGEPRHEGEPVTESCTLDSPVGKSAYAIIPGASKATSTSGMSPGPWSCWRKDRKRPGAGSSSRRTASLSAIFSASSPERRDALRRVSRSGNRRFAWRRSWTRESAA